MSDLGHEPTHRPLPIADVQPLPPFVAKPEQPAAAQEYREAIDALFEHPMTKEEADCFRREKAAEFVPLKPEQTRLLPPRKK
jgi:hypothetical protein